MKQGWTIPDMTNEVLMIGFQSEGGEGLHKLHLLLPSWAGQDHAWWGHHNHHHVYRFHADDWIDWPDPCLETFVSKLTLLSRICQSCFMFFSPFATALN